MKNNLMELNLQFFGGEEAGDTVSEAAEPTTDATEVESSATTEGEPSTEEAPEEASNVQSAEENAKYAAARRKAEAEFAEKQRRYDAEFERRFKDYNNPITGEPIKNQRDYFAALDAQEKLTRDKELRDAGINPQVIEDYVNRQVENNPIVQQAQVVMQQAAESQMKSRLADDIKAINKLNPNLKTLDDVFALPNAEQMVALVQNSRDAISLADAYKIVNFDDLMAGKTASAKQATLNNLNGTSHLNQTDGVTDGGNNEVEIPANELDQWKKAFPGVSMADLRKKYNKAINS